MEKDREYLKEKARLKAQQRIKLEEIVDGGKWNYVWVRGVAMFGGFMFIFMTLFDKFLWGYELDSFVITLNFVIWAIAGFLFGLWTWKNINKKLIELKRK